MFKLNPRMIIIFQAQIPISFEHMSFWISIHRASSNSTIGVGLRSPTKLGTSTLCEMWSQFEVNGYFTQFSNQLIVDYIDHALILIHTKSQWCSVSIMWEWAFNMIFNVVTCNTMSHVTLHNITQPRSHSPWVQKSMCNFTHNFIVHYMNCKHTMIFIALCNKFEAICLSTISNSASVFL